ncbi:unnamed protein product [Ixodes pacificus]
MSEKGDCLSCLKKIGHDAACIKCSECANYYHMGKCSGLTKNVMKSMNDVEISEWQCNTCKLYSQRQSATPEVSQSALELTPNEEKLERLLKQNESISAKLTSVLHRMHEELIVHLDNQDKTITELQRKIGELEGRISQRDEEVGELRKAIDNAELYSRRQNIEIHGMVQQPNEDIMSVINRVATKLDLAPVTPNDIEAAHRLKAKEGRITPILVRFTERRTRDLWVRKRTTLRNENIYINENLTRALKSLLWSTKAHAKEKGYMYTWMKNGKIFVRQKEGAAVIQIESERDLIKIR